jgi:flagellar M-ring protein FliF
VIKRFWAGLAQQLGSTGRSVLVVGAVALLAAAVFVAFWLSRTEYQTLFADLTPQDSAAMTAELDRLKIPYTVGERTDASGESTGTILVDKNEVLRTRIKLMGKEIPLHGAVGFELFNNNDIGMTEFAQKINYQRALQGELTRTILSLAEVRDARVLLALPDQGLFRQATVRPKASVTLSMKKGQGLRAEQVAGIQRLVSAAVPGISAQDVTIVDQSGIALTRNAAGATDTDEAAGTGRLDLKKETEAYLARKATAVLERTMGPGQALASVDVVLNMDRVQVKTDEVIGAPGKPGGAPTGVVTRQRETSRDPGAPLNATSSAGAAMGGGSSQQEVEYALGRRVEQVMSQPGSVRRVQVAVVVKQTLQPPQLEQLRQTVAASVGASLERGDAVVIQSIAGFAAPLVAGTDMPAASDSREPAGDSAHGSLRTSEPDRWTLPSSMPMSSAVAVLFVFLIFGVWAIARGTKVQTRSLATLSEDERLEALARVRAWMQPQGGGVPRPAIAGAMPGSDEERRSTGVSR